MLYPYGQGHHLKALSSKENGIPDWWRRYDFPPELLTERFTPGKLYSPSAVREYLASIDWPWDEASLLNFEGKKIFFQVWEKEIPLSPTPILLRGIGLYPVDAEKFRDKELTRDELYTEEGALYLYRRYADGDWGLMHRVSDDYWQGRTELQLAINESNTCAWLTEIPPPDTGTGLQGESALWRNLLTGEIDLWYTIYWEEYLPSLPVDETKDDSLLVEKSVIVTTVLYGLRYDWLPDGTRFIRAPDRLLMQIEEGRFEDFYTPDYDFVESGEACAMSTLDYLCTGDQYLLLSFGVEGMESPELSWRYTGEGNYNSPYKSGMPSYGYHVHQDWREARYPIKELFD